MVIQQELRFVRLSKLKCECYSPDLKQHQLLHLHLVLCIKAQNQLKEMQKVSKQTGMQLIKVSKVLGIKPSLCYSGMMVTTQFSEQFDFMKPKFSLVRQKFLFTSNQQEHNFVNSSVASSLIMQQININLVSIHRLYQVQSPIFGNKAKKLLCQNNVLLKIIILFVKTLFSELQPNYFYHQLRKNYTGFSKALFQGVALQQVQNMAGIHYQMHQKGVLITSNGATAGQDPNYQAFQNLMGFEFQEQLKSTQNFLSLGMTRLQRETIQECRKLSIRRICEQRRLKDQYNQLCLGYIQFLKIHNSLIEQYIVKQGKDLRGTANLSIKAVLSKPHYINKKCLL